MRSVLVLVVLGAAAGARADEQLDADSARFSAAVALEARGAYSEAVAALEQFASERPESPLAPDALAEVGELCETKLFEPARAVASYRRLVSRYPENRLATRAATRKVELERLLDDPHTDAASVGALLRLVEGSATPSTEDRQKVARFLDEHPDFARADRAHLWLGHAAEAARDLDEAKRRYALAARGADHTAAAAQHDLAMLLLRTGRIDEAEAAAQALSRFSDPLSPRARAEALRAVRSARLEHRLRIVALVVLGLFVLGHLRGLRLAPIPIEVRFLAPVAILFAIVAAFQPRPTARAVAMIAAGGVVVAWLSQGRSRELRSGVERILRALAAALAVAAVLYLAIVTNDLKQTIVETLKHGPD